MRGAWRDCGVDRVVGPRKVPNGETKRETRCNMNKIITQSVKVAVTASALAAALTGCCLFGSGEACCGKPDCCCKNPCACCCKDACGKECCHGRKTSGVNTSVTLGVGTDGIRVGSDSNIGSHGASMHMNADAGRDGISAGAGAGVR